MDIIQNAVKIVEEGNITYLPSIHRHHFNGHTFKNGGSYAIDGGLDYMRIISNNIPNDVIIEDYSLSSNCSFDEICEKLLWGTRGKTGRESIKYLPFKELEVDHLKSILEYNNKLSVKLSKLQTDVINYWIKTKEKKL